MYYCIICRTNPKKDPFSHTLVTRRRHRDADPLFFASCSQGPVPAECSQQPGLSTQPDNTTTASFLQPGNAASISKFAPLKAEDQKEIPPSNIRSAPLPPRNTPSLGLCFPINRRSFHRLPILSVVSPVVLRLFKYLFSYTYICHLLISDCPSPLQPTYTRPSYLHVLHYQDITNNASYHI